MDNQWRVYKSVRSPFDPCPPIRHKAFIVPVNQYLAFQPRSMKQFAPRDALRNGTLWPELYSPYVSPVKDGGPRE